jgi:hypothetical protein
MTTRAEIEATQRVLNRQELAFLVWQKAIGEAIVQALLEVAADRAPDDFSPVTPAEQARIRSRLDAIFREHYAAYHGDESGELGRLVLDQAERGYVDAFRESRGTASRILRAEGTQ